MAAGAEIRNADDAFVKAFGITPDEEKQANQEEKRADAAITQSISQLSSVVSEAAEKSTLGREIRADAPAPQDALSADAKQRVADVVGLFSTDGSDGTEGPAFSPSVNTEDAPNDPYAQLSGGRDSMATDASTVRDTAGPAFGANEDTPDPFRFAEHEAAGLERFQIRSKKMGVMAFLDLGDASMDTVMVETATDSAANTAAGAAANWPGNPLGLKPEEIVNIPPNPMELNKTFTEEMVEIMFRRYPETPRMKALKDMFRWFQSTRERLQKDLVDVEKQMLIESSVKSTVSQLMTSIFQNSVKTAIDEATRESTSQIQEAMQSILGTSSQSSGPNPVSIVFESRHASGAPAANSPEGLATLFSNADSPSGYCRNWQSTTSSSQLSNKKLCPSGVSSNLVYNVEISFGDSNGGPYVFQVKSSGNPFSWGGSLSLDDQPLSTKSGNQMFWQTSGSDSSNTDARITPTVEVSAGSSHKLVFQAATAYGDAAFSIMYAKGGGNYQEFKATGQGAAAANGSAATGSGSTGTSTGSASGSASGSGTASGATTTP
eukprot:GILK01000673.1.p1 GENE.GILK01000673.1~~GILK01000673.1.p1  ORF type:complete len:617 (+),score=95.34 GILK01000673.1:209-1852(+)